MDKKAHVEVHELSIRAWLDVNHVAGRVSAIHESWPSLPKTPCAINATSISLVSIALLSLLLLVLSAALTPNPVVFAQKGFQPTLHNVLDARIWTEMFQVEGLEPWSPPLVV